MDTSSIQYYDTKKAQLPRISNKKGPRAAAFDASRGCVHGGDSRHPPSADDAIHPRDSSNQRKPLMLQRSRALPGGNQRRRAVID